MSAMHGEAPAFLLDENALRATAARHHLKSDAQIARALGTSPATLSRVLAGHQLPGNELLAAIAAKFGGRAYQRIVHLATF